jgi:hypothetical protein
MRPWGIFDAIWYAFLSTRVATTAARLVPHKKYRLVVSGANSRAREMHTTLFLADNISHIIIGKTAANHRKPAKQLLF